MSSSRLFAIIPLLLLVSATDPRKPAASEAGIDVYFSPGGGAADVVVSAIGEARKEIVVATYSITHARIAKSITDAHDRGVKVTVLMDKTQASGRYSSATYLHNAGIAVFVDGAAGLMHHKFAIVDGETLLTGSFNWTKGGDEENAENLMVITGKPKLAAAFQAEFEKQIQKAQPYSRPAD